jgi:signal transduction histidine kinase
MFRIRNASHELGRRELNPAQKTQIEGLETLFTQRDEPTPDALSVNSLEDELDSLFRSHGQNDLWQLSADLARRGVQPDLIESLYASLEPDTAKAALVRIASLIDAANLLKEIESSTTRISELVKAIKEYTFMDQTPIQNVDIVKGLEGTLTILNHKLKKGVTVHRDYQDVPLLVNSFGSELNQVWTNIIDNAIDAMHGQGELRVRAYRDDNCVVVEIIDNGPGISSEARPHIFEPFFTTKGVGEGTGLGLDTAQRIVRKHRGNIEVDSEPGKTMFQVWIPMSDSEMQKPPESAAKTH